MTKCKEGGAASRGGERGIRRRKGGALGRGEVRGRALGRGERKEAGGNTNGADTTGCRSLAG